MRGVRVVAVTATALTLVACSPEGGEEPESSGPPDRSSATRGATANATKPPTKAEPEDDSQNLLKITDSPRVRWSRGADQLAPALRCSSDCELLGGIAFDDQVLVRVEKRNLPNDPVSPERTVFVSLSDDGEVRWRTSLAEGGRRDCSVGEKRLWCVWEKPASESEGSGEFRATTYDVRTGKNIKDVALDQDDRGSTEIIETTPTAVYVGQRVGAQREIAVVTRITESGAIDWRTAIQGEPQEFPFPLYGFEDAAKLYLGIGEDYDTVLDRSTGESTPLAGTAPGDEDERAEWDRKSKTLRINGEPSDFTMTSDIDSYTSRPPLAVAVKPKPADGSYPQSWDYRWKAITSSKGSTPTYDIKGTPESYCEDVLISRGKDIVYGQDGDTGKVLWEVPWKAPTHVQCTRSAVALKQGDAVTLLDPRSGKSTHSVRVPGSGKAEYDYGAVISRSSGGEGVVIARGGELHYVR